jgi:hypothetical protein
MFEFLRGVNGLQASAVILLVMGVTFWLDGKRK